jgi:hypothetical protein
LRNQLNVTCIVTNLFKRIKRNLRKDLNFIIIIINETINELLIIREEIMTDCKIAYQ